MLRYVCVLLLGAVSASAASAQETCGGDPATTPNHSDNYILGIDAGDGSGLAMHWTTGLV